MEYIKEKHWKYIVSVVKSILKMKIQSVRKIKQNRLMRLSNCTICGKKKSNFIKNKELHNFNNSLKMNILIT